MPLGGAFPCRNGTSTRCARRSSRDADAWHLLIAPPTSQPPVGQRSHRHGPPSSTLLARDVRDVLDRIIRLRFPPQRGRSLPVNTSRLVAYRDANRPAEPAGPVPRTCATRWTAQRDADGVLTFCRPVSTNCESRVSDATDRRG